MLRPVDLDDGAAGILVSSLPAGEDARGVDANVPFVVGTMSKGNDERGDLSDFTPGKQTVDSVHKNIANLVPRSEVVLMRAGTE